jgi:hypothetical protein
MCLLLPLVVQRASAAPPPLSCPELGIFTIGVSVARNKGIAVAKLKRDIDEDVNFSARDKTEFRTIIDLVYNRPADSGTKLSYIVEKKCHKTDRPR